MTRRLEWEREARAADWSMATVPGWKRLPVIRHLRALYWMIQAHRLEAELGGMGLASDGYYRWAAKGIWMGKERTR